MDTEGLDIDIGDSISPRIPTTATLAPHIATRFIHQPGDEWPTHVVLVQTLIVPMTQMNTENWKFVAEAD